jgi:hypothetical protein
MNKMLAAQPKDNEEEQEEVKSEPKPKAPSKKKMTNSAESAKTE